MQERNDLLQDAIALGKQRAAELGIPATGKRMAHLTAEATEQARKDTDAQFNQTADIDREANRRIRRFLAWVAVVFVALFLLGGTIAVVVMFPIAEAVAVYGGILAFTNNAFLAAFNSATVVVGLVVLLFIRNLLRDNLPDGVSPAHSLRTTGGRLAYYLGLTDQPPTVGRSAEMYLGSVAAVTTLQAVIVFLGFQGRAAEAMAGVDGTYYDFLVGLFTGATPVEFFGYVGTALLTIALLRVTDLVVLFIYTIFINTVGTLDIGGKPDSETVARFLETRSLELQLNAVNDLVTDAAERQRRRALNSDSTD